MSELGVVSRQLGFDDLFVMAGPNFDKTLLCGEIIFQMDDNRRFVTITHDSVYLSDEVAQARGYSRALVHPLVLMRAVFGICESGFVVSLTSDAHSIDYNKNIIHGLRYRIQLKLESLHSKRAVLSFELIGENEVWATGRLSLAFP